MWSSCGWRRRVIRSATRSRASGDVTADGRPVFFSGSKLAPDLSLPKLLAAWGDAEGGLVADPVAAAARRVGLAQAAVVRARRGEPGEDPGLIAHAAADVLTALRGRSPDLDAAAAVFDRAARPPRGSSDARARWARVCGG